MLNVIVGYHDYDTFSKSLHFCNDLGLKVFLWVYLNLKGRIRPLWLINNQLGRVVTINEKYTCDMNHVLKHG